MTVKTIIAALRHGFTDTLAQFQAVIIFALVVYWFSSRWEAIREKFTRDNLGPTLFGVILVFSIYVGVMFAMDWGLEYMGLAVMLACSIALALCDTAISICVFIALLFLRPWEIIQNNDYFLVLPKLTMSLCVMNACFDFTKRKVFTINWNTTATALTGFAVWLLVTTVKSANPSESQGIFFDVFFKDVFLFILVLNLVRSIGELDLIIWTIVITMFGVGAASIFQTWQYQDSPLLAAMGGFDSEDLRLVGFGAFENSNDIGALMVMVLPFCLVPTLDKKSHWFTRVVGLLTMFMVSLCIIMAKSRGAQLGVVAIGGLYAFLKMKNTKHALMLGVVGFIAMMGAMQMTNRNETDLDESRRFRMIYLETGIVMGVKNPVFGVGYEGYADSFTRYQTGEVDGTTHRTAHNSWVLAFAETGVFGILLFVSIFGSALLMAWKIRRRQPTFLLALVGYGIAMSFLSHTYLIYPYLLYALTGLAAQLYGALPEDSVVA